MSSAPGNAPIDMTKVRRAAVRDRGEWLRMRSALWPHAAAEHAREVDAYLGESDEQSAVFVAEHSPREGLCGFIEARLRDYADGCSTSPVAYVEGWYVDPETRRARVAAALLEAAECWSRALGLAELASDSELENEVGRQVHLALGFEQVGCVVQFRKSLKAVETPMRESGSGCMPSDVREFFERYRAAFDRLDAGAIAALYSTPSGILSGRTYAHWPDFESVRGNMLALCEQYRSGGFLAAHYEAAWIEQLGQDAVIADLAWNVERSDGQEPWRFHTTYNLVRSDSGWRILLCTAYEEERLG